MDKENYFPRKRLFEESQDLIATFYSTGEHISDITSEFASMLAQDTEKDVFYYCLYLLSMMSNTSEIIKIIEKIINDLNSIRKKKRVTSTEEFIGEIDIEEYIKKNYIESVNPKEYPSVIKYSTYQLPEYQLTLYIIRRMIEIYHNIFLVLGDNEGISVFKKTHEYIECLRKKALLLNRKYGIDYSKRESYLSLKKKVVYRYRNRRILTNDFKILMKLYEKMLLFKGIDFESDTLLEVFEHYPKFDDRLYEIWLIRKSTELLCSKMCISPRDIEYTPLFEARKKNKYAVLLSAKDYRIEILFQNRKSYMPKSDLKWFYRDEDGRQNELGAIPDLVFMKYNNNERKPIHIVLVDAKNRMWTLDNMKPIKSEIVQQIFIHDSFITLFEEEYSSILIAHNNDKLQYRKIYHKDKMHYEIDVISMDMNDGMIELSLDKYIKDLSEYLEI